MNRFWTSDTHFSHARIIELCGRPFEDVDHMNEEIIRRWNSVVTPQDIVFHLGDVALGPIDKSLPLVGRLNGYKILLPGNHDRVFSGQSQNHIKRFWPQYKKVFNVIWSEVTRNDIIDHEEGKMFPVVMSHFPYDGDSHGEDRYVDKRPADDGAPLIHGHTHRTDTATRSAKNTPQFHVGMDAHFFYPVPESTLLDWIKSVQV